MGSAASSFIIDDAIIGLAQPLTEALNQLASGPRRACDVIEELSRREHFYLDLAGGSSGRTAGAVFHNAHLPYKLPCADPAEKDRVAIEFPEYVDGTAEEAKNSVRPISLSEEDLPFGKMLANHGGPLNCNRWRIEGSAWQTHRRAGGAYDAPGRSSRSFTVRSNKCHLGASIGA